jgi:integrase
MDLLLNHDQFVGRPGSRSARQSNLIVAHAGPVRGRGHRGRVAVETPDYDTGKGLTLPQARTLIAAVKPTRWHGIYVLALMLGVRRGEVLGLRWSDVDFGAGTLAVRNNLLRAGGELRMQAPKTGKSRRTLPSPVLAARREQRAKQATDRLAAAPRGRTTTWSSPPLSARQLSRET